MLSGLCGSDLGQKNPNYVSEPFFNYNTLQRHCTKNSKQIFPEIKLRGLVGNSYIHVSESN